MLNMVFRNLKSIARRYPTAAALNLVGLAVAIAALLVIMMRVNYEYHFESCHSKADRIYRIVQTGEDAFFQGAIHSCPFVDEFIASSPQIEAGTIYNTFGGDAYISVEQQGEQVGYKEPIRSCYPDIVKLFDFRMVEGDASCLAQGYEQALIPQSMAHRLFGDSPAVGKMLRLEEEPFGKEDCQFLTIGGVYEDFPRNTQLDNAIYTQLSEVMHRMTGMNFTAYVLLTPGADAQAIAANFNAHSEHIKRFQEAGYAIQAELQRLPDVYFLSKGMDAMFAKAGDREETMLWILIGLVVLAIAGINFTNYQLALAPLRIRNINTHKVLGSSDAALRMSLLAEAMAISLAAYAIGICIAWGMNRIGWLSFIDADLDMSHAANISIVCLCGLIALGLGMVAGLYPAWYVTSFPPALVLKGNFGLSATGKKLRTGLVGFQFIVSIILIVSALFMKLQSNYMNNLSLGFDKDRVLVTTLNDKIIQNSKQAYISELRKNAGIEDVAFSFQKLGASDTYLTGSITYKNENIRMMFLPVSWNFLDVMGIYLIDGERPTQRDEESPTLYLYEPLAKQYGITALDKIDNEGGQTKVGGIVSSPKFSSLKNEMTDAALIIGDNYPMKVSYIRMKAGADASEVIAYVKQTIHALDPTYPADVETYPTVLNQFYEKDEQLMQMVYVFSSLAIILSLMGVFSLVMFETLYRKKEIGIRKVLGASIYEVLMMFGRRYFWIVLICSVIAIPFAYYGVNLWLQNFAYKTPMYIWVFLLAFFLVMLITQATVLIQSWKAATANPVESIKEV